jgi:maleate cis-trans isomerase
MTEPRARIGYTSVAYVTEIFPKLFYELVPEGVLLQILTQHVSSHADGNMKYLHEEARATVETFVRAGSDMVILGGSPTNLSRGEKALEEALNDLSVEFGIPVSSSATAQIKALRAVNAHRVGIIHPASNSRNKAQLSKLSDSGFEPVICLGVGATFEDYNRISKNTALDLGRNLLEKDQEIDTLLYSCPHWPLADTVEILEKTYNVTVVTSFNAIIWEGLRSCGIKDQIHENGRLLREY